MSEKYMKFIPAGDLTYLRKQMISYTKHYIVADLINYDELLFLNMVIFHSCVK